MKNKCSSITINNAGTVQVIPDETSVGSFYLFEGNLIFVSDSEFLAIGNSELGDSGASLEFGDNEKLILVDVEISIKHRKEGR